MGERVFAVVKDRYLLTALHVSMKDNLEILSTGSLFLSFQLMAMPHFMRL